MSGQALEQLLRRDRAVIAAALIAITGLAWAYVLWLADDMAMGGMDMTDFRMIPSGPIQNVVLTIPRKVFPRKLFIRRAP